MAEEALGAWFENHREALTQRFKEAAVDPLRFPGFSALQPRQLREVIQREVNGLVSFMKSDNESLEQATSDHKSQNQRFLANISIQEQLDFLQRRVEIVQELFSSEPDTERMRRAFQRKFEMAERFYRTQSRAIDLEQRFSAFSDGAS